MYRIISIFSLVLILFSCKKKEHSDLTVSEEVKVYLSSEAYNIPTSGSVIDFDILNENDIIALVFEPAHLKKVYVTHDGGMQWEEIHDTINPTNYYPFPTKIVYIDENNLAFISNGILIRSFDGGVSWNSSKGITDTVGVIGIGMSSENELIVVETLLNHSVNIYKSSNNSADYQLIGQCNWDKDYDFLRANINKDFITLFSEGPNCMTGFDLITLEQTATVTTPFIHDHINIIQRVNDALFVGDKVIVASMWGNCYEYTASFGFKNIYNSADNNKFYSVADMDAFQTIIGNNQIITNFKEEWLPVSSESGEFSIAGIYKMKKYNDQKFIIAGVNGLFQKANFY